MKTKILVLDAYTNGHEAAMKFIRKKKWKRSECELVFCGTHPALLERLSEGPAYGVVPIRNSIAGPVKEVLDAIDQIQLRGFQFDRKDQLDLQINHYLMAPKHVKDPRSLTGVMSHEKAIAQCGSYLDSIGITTDKRSAQDSTGNAAKIVSRLPAGVMIGAIAPKNAAKAYGLRILAMEIQNIKKNITTFLLLENEAYVRPVTVGIIGCDGRFGRVLTAFFKGLGCSVIGSDVTLPKGLTNAQVVQQADVVIFAVKISKTVEVIQSVLRYSRSDQLFMDVTSVKQPAITAMLKSRAQVVGLHPMFAPEVGFEGQTIVYCPERLTNKGWRTWVVNVLAKTGATIKQSSGEMHDIYMATVQGSPHLANFANAVLIMQMGIMIRESLTFTSPAYRIMFSLMGRLLSQKAELYSGILMKNPAIVPMLENRIAIEQDLLDIIKRKDAPAFTELFAKVKGYFGDDVAKEANELFLRLLSVTKTLYGKNTAVLEFAKKDNQPGLLERVAKTFRQYKINLTGFNSVDLDGRRSQFTISFEQARASYDVRRALERIESWKTPRITIVS